MTATRRRRSRRGIRQDPVGSGVYSLQMAGRLSGLRVTSIRRYLVGRGVPARGGIRRYPARFKGDYVREHDGRATVAAVSFRDLIELRMIAAFEKHGLSWKEIVTISSALARKYHYTHPFSQHFLGKKAFVFDGDIVEADKAGAPTFVGMTGQQIMGIAAPFMHELTLNERGDPILWTPEAGRGRVVIDPSRNFGAPIIDDGEYATEVILQSWVEHERDEDAVAAWWGITREDVQSAIAFEQAFPARRTAAA